MGIGTGSWQEPQVVAKRRASERPGWSIMKGQWRTSGRGGSHPYKAKGNGPGGHPHTAVGTAPKGLPQANPDSTV